MFARKTRSHAASRRAPSRLQISTQEHSIIAERLLAQRPVEFRCEFAAEAAAMQRMNPSRIDLLDPVDHLPDRRFVGKNAYLPVKSSSHGKRASRSELHKQP